MIGGVKNTSDVVEEVLQYQGAPMPKPTDKDSADPNAMLKKRRYSCASTFLMLLRRFQLSPNEGGARSSFVLDKLADLFGLQVRGRYRGQENKVRSLSKITLSMDGMSEVLALFLTFPWLVHIVTSSRPQLRVISYVNWSNHNISRTTVKPSLYHA